MKTAFMCALALLHAILLAGSAHAAAMGPKGMPPSIRDALVKDLPVVSAKTIFVDYSGNEIAAEDKYKGKIFILGGAIDRIAVGLDGIPHANLLVPGSSVASVRMEFPPSARKNLATLQAGQSIMAVCTGGSMVLWTVYASCQPEWAILPDVKGPSKAATRMQIEPLLARADELNGVCRGSSHPEETKRYCDERDQIMDEIRSAGWCWGHQGQAGYQRTWVVCQPGD